MSSKAYDVKMFLDSTGIKFDVTMFSESWYNDNSSTFLLPNYNNFVLNRAHKWGGGVAIQTALSLNSEPLTEFTVSTDE